MTSFFQALVVMGFFVAANVVAAGVILVLGMAMQRAAPALESPLAWIIICAGGALAAYLFLKGAIICAGERARLQCRSGRRGG